MNPKKFFYVLVGILAALVLTGGGGYYYALTMLQSTSQQLASKQAEQIAADEQLDGLNKMKSQYTKDIAPILPLMDQALPRTKKQTEVLAQLQRIAKESGLTITSVSLPSASGLPTATSQTVPTGQVLALPIAFDVSGSFSQLQTFLTKVETLSRFTNVTNLTVTRPDKTKSIIYSMTVNAYMKP